EMLFYSVVPILFLAFRKASCATAVAATAATAVVNLALQAWVNSSGYLSDALTGSFRYYNIVNQMPVFLLGIVYWQLVRRHPTGGLALPATVFLMFSAVSLATMRFNLFG